jgi:hypothetical protein
MQDVPDHGLCIPNRTKPKTTTYTYAKQHYTIHYHVNSKSGVNFQFTLKRNRAKRNPIKINLLVLYFNSLPPPSLSLDGICGTWMPLYVDLSEALRLDIRDQWLFITGCAIYWIKYCINRLLYGTRITLNCKCSSLLYTCTYVFLYIYIYHPALLHGAVSSQPTQQHTAKFLGVDWPSYQGSQKLVDSALVISA